MIYGISPHSALYFSFRGLGTFSSDRFSRLPSDTLCHACYSVLYYMIWNVCLHTFQCDRWYIPLPHNRYIRPWISLRILENIGLWNIEFSPGIYTDFCLHCIYLKKAKHNSMLKSVVLFSNRLIVYIKLKKSIVISWNIKETHFHIEVPSSVGICCRRIYTLQIANVHYHPHILDYSLHLPQNNLCTNSWRRVFLRDSKSFLQNIDQIPGTVHTFLLLHIQYSL